MSAEWPLVKPGAEGARVKALPRLLLHRGADGIAGPHTWQLLIVEN